jgi:hypothetical protein
MAYRIRPDKDFTVEFKAVATQKLQAAIAVLESPADDPHKAIHEARKIFKRVRALYRLIRHDARDFQRHENLRLHDMARSLSTVRNATALIEAVTDLQVHAKTPEEAVALSFSREALANRRDHLAREELDLAERMAAAIAGCHQAVDAVGYIEFDDSRHKTARRLARAWHKSLGHAATALEECHAQASAEHFHELRKCGQTYFMHLGLLRDLWPTAMQAKRSEAKQLVDMLGHEHDLSVLSELIDAQPHLFGRGEDLAHLLGAIISRQQALRHDALELADRVFADEAGQESSIIERLWAGAP